MNFTYPKLLSCRKLYFHLPQANYHVENYTSPITFEKKYVHHQTNLMCYSKKCVLFIKIRFVTYVTWC